jgi:hypothetical protein
LQYNLPLNNIILQQYNYWKDYLALRIGVFIRGIWVVIYALFKLFGSESYRNKFGGEEMDIYSPLIKLT